MREVNAKGSGPGGAGSWRERVRSPSFRRGLEDVIRDEILASKSHRLHELVDDSAVRAAIAGAGPELAVADANAKVMVGVNERIEKRLRKERRSIDEVLGPELRDEVDGLLDEELPNPEALEEILAQVIRQRFVRKLLAELIHSAIISFNKRVNPFFGGITAAVLEDQIKAFIELGMPMLQAQAVAFALRRSNQQFAIDLAQSLLRGIMAEPIGDLVPPSSTGQRKRIEHLIARALASERFREAVPATIEQLWDDLYSQVRDKKVSQMVDVGLLADNFAGPIADLMISSLARPRIAEFLEEQLRD